MNNKESMIRLFELLIRRNELEKEIKRIEDWLNLNKGEYDLSVRIILNKSKYDSSMVDYANEFIEEYQHRVTSKKADEYSLEEVNEYIEEM